VCPDKSSLIIKTKRRTPMNFWRWITPVGLAVIWLWQPQPAVGDSKLQAAIEKYDRAVQTKDVETVKTLLAPDVLLYEHSVRNDGLQDVFENHLKPEITEFENMKMEFIDVRLISGTDLALLTRQYKIQGKLGGREINATGNETLVWKHIGSDWKIVHIHYSHACPRPPTTKQ
jgi:ketosteroid isomerase-like protein